MEWEKKEIMPHNAEEITFSTYSHLWNGYYPFLLLPADIAISGNPGAGQGVPPIYSAYSAESVFGLLNEFHFTWKSHNPGGQWSLKATVSNI